MCGKKPIIGCLEQLFNIFNEIRNPYARSETSIAFGVKRRVDYTSLLLEQFNLIKQECPDKDYEQGPMAIVSYISYRKLIITS